MKRVLLRSLYLSFFVFFALFGVAALTKIKIFNAFDPISQALQEFELTDWVFSHLRETPKPDDRIVLVNIGPSRAAIAEQLRIISKYKPKVIGIDSYFNCEGGYYDTLNCPQLLDTLGNLMLGNAIHEAGNVVLVSRLLQSDSLFKAGTIDLYDSIEKSDPIYSDFSKNAFANLPTGATYQEDIKVCRNLIPRMIINGKDEYAFSVKIAMMYDSVKTGKFLRRNNNEEVINFRGNFDIPDVKVKNLREGMNTTSEYRTLCYAIDWRDLMQGNYDSSMFKNSIVMIGFLGDYFGDPAWEDKFFTPLNSKVAGRANPDMFGLVVHANAVAMIINEDYVNELAEWQKYTIAFIICFLNVMLFSWVDKKFPILYDGFSVVLQLIQIILVSLLVVMIFATYSIKMDLTLTIGILAMVGPCFDISKSVEKTLYKVLHL